ncbi:GNAT family N-acetyltransferase [Nocardioides guangzhouensis]|uniref:GNAT family N-acetyltransferase n=1 Tax=Nocardioides guangzhouensis TaxID=2497878 RepID=A0A4Q4ZG87_9ACTN|nr:GNAT family N-acetyltransferase [Nocardioides guangzhouensis]RYP86451.1 GNAT family N-acetyltransferase [Nocardioides guangzhouensis]
MDVRSLAFRTDLALLVLGGSLVEDHDTHLVVRTPANPGFHWGNFYLLASPPAAGDVDALLTAYDADFPESTHRALGVDGTADQSAALAPLVAAGPALDAGTVMTARSVHAPPRPNTEAELRPLTSDDDWAKRVEVSAACHPEYPREQYLDFATRKATYERGLVEAGHGAWWGAFLDGRLVSGMGLMRAGAGLARFQSVETHPDFRGRGLAGTLVHHVGAWGLSELGARTLVMVADPEYLAARIYRSCGFVDSEVQTQLVQLTRS